MQANLEPQVLEYNNPSVKVAMQVGTGRIHAGRHKEYSVCAESPGTQAGT